MSCEPIEGYGAAERTRAPEDLLAFLAAQGHERHPWSLIVEEGTAFDVLAKAVRETQPYLLIIGSRGRSGIAKVLLGSIAEETLRKIEVDILIVPPAKPQTV